MAILHYCSQLRRHLLAIVLLIIILILFLDYFLGGDSTSMLPPSTENALNNEASSQVPDETKDYLDQKMDFLEPTRLTYRRKTAKLILLWTTWFGSPTWWDIIKRLENKSPLIRSSYNSSWTCRLTTDEGDTELADAIIFNARDFNPAAPKLPPGKRKPNQRWVLLQLEAQINAHWSAAQWRAAEKLQFNWTMGYPRKANVYYPYGKVYSRPAEQTRNSSETFEQVKVRTNSFVENFAQRKYDALWIVSNCKTSSRREQIVKELRQAGLTINERGDCAKRKPEEDWAAEGYDNFIKSHRFWIAFENSLCTEYLSEKPFYALNASQAHGVIPVVYGGANYSEHLPCNSFVDTKDYSTTAKLAEYLKSLSDAANVDKLRQHYQWQFDSYVDPDPFWRVKNGWRTLCDKLLEDELPKDSKPHESTSRSEEKAPTLLETWGHCNIWADT